MMKNEIPQNKPPRRKITLLVALVAFVFAVLLLSLSISSIFLVSMNRLGLMQPISDNRLPFIIVFLLLVSLLVSCIVTYVAGNLSLRPLQKFIDASDQIAAGNFDVRVEGKGPEEYKRLVGSFNKMAKELGSIETLRNDFVSTISHEYKTPLVSIRGFAKLLKKDNLTDAQRQEYLNIIIAETDRLTQLSSNVLLLSKLNSSDTVTEIAEYSLDEQLRRAIALLNQQIEKKKIQMEIELEPCRITSSEELLHQVWINLLNNAVKFTPEGGQIGVSLVRENGQVRVTVRDTGIGMAPEVARRVFDKFYQGESSRSAEGNGLGLSLVKRILDLLKGEIGVESEMGQGSTFTVTLPGRDGGYQENLL